MSDLLELEFQIAVSWELNLGPLQEHPVFLTAGQFFLLFRLTYFSWVSKQADPWSQCVTLKKVRKATEVSKSPGTEVARHFNRSFSSFSV